MFEDELKEDEGAIPMDDAAPQEAASPGVEASAGAIPMDDEAPQEAASPGVAGENSLAPVEAPQEGASPNVGGNKPRNTGFQGLVDIATEGGTGQQGPLKRIISYLMGNDAVPIEQANALGQEVDPEGRLSPGQRNLAAIHAAAERGGDEQAWKIVQAQRVAFNAKQAFAYAALNGTAQKPPDIRAAVDAANQAQAHVVDGSDVEFAVGPNGVTATVNDGSGVARPMQLTPDQFRRYLNVGGDGQYDKLMQKKIPQALQEIASGAPDPRRVAQRQARPMQGVNTGRQENTNTIPVAENTGRAPIQHEIDDGDTGYSRQDRNRASQMFPTVGQASERSQWLAQNARHGEDNQVKRDVASIGATGKVTAAGVTAGGRLEANDRKIESNEGIAADRIASQERIAAGKREAWERSSDAKRADAMRKLEFEYKRLGSQNANQAQNRIMKDILAKRATMDKLTPQETELLGGYMQDAQGARPVTRPGAEQPTQNPGAQPTQNAPQQQAAPARGQPPEAGARFLNGKWYRRAPDGKAELIQ